MSAAHSGRHPLYEHVLGAGSPSSSRLESGALTDDWTDEYLRLLREATQEFERKDYLHRDVVAAVHYASWYLRFRYDSWRAFEAGKTNERTEINLHRLRSPSELLLLCGHVDLTRKGNSG